MKTAMVWGANGGIGRALTEKLIDDDWTVVAVTHQPNGADELKQHVIEVDTASPYEVELAITTASQLVQDVDMFVYTVGDITTSKVAEMNADDWWRILDANLTGAFLATRFSLPLLAPNAHLFYLGAISERLRLPGLSAYAAAKAGLEAFVEALSKEERKRAVTIVRPGAVDTPFWERVSLRLPKNALSADCVADEIMTAYEQKHVGVLNLEPNK